MSSSVEDDTILKSLIESALKLPFNLLNLEPLQKIKIVTMNYPFVLMRRETGTAEKAEKLETMTDLNSQRNETIYDWMSENLQSNETKVFNLAGAKFGRSP